MPRIVKSSYVKLGDIRKVENKCYIESSLTQEGNTNRLIENHFEESHFREKEKQKLKEIELQAKQILNDAKQQAKAIIKDAYEDAKQIFENAKTDGYNKGYSEGYKAAKNDAQKIIKEALDIKQQIQATKKKIFKESEQEIISLIIDTVEKILNCRIEDSYETIIGLVKSALEKCTYTESLTLRVSPKDYEYVMNAKDKILCLAENIDNIHIKQDNSLSKGSCIIDTVSGSIDSSIKTQLDQIKSLFKELLEGE